MNPITAATQFGLQLATQLPGMIQAGADILEVFRAGTAKLELFAAEKRDPTVAEWDALNASINGKLKDLNAGN